MPRYAYIPFDANYEERLPNVVRDDFRNKKVFKVDSTTITEKERSIIKKKFKGFYCYSCDSKMKFRKQKNRHNHFAHISRKECFEAESLAHASVKKDLFKRFKLRGYQVAVERVFKSNKKQLRTDIAVMEKTDILAIEVQASPSIKRSTIAERTNTYSSEGIPTAWIIVLDSFFGEGNFTSTKESIIVKNEDGTSSYVDRWLPYSAPTPFIVTVDIPKSFYFLFDKYKYVVAVNHDGHFFFIRKTDLTEDSLEIFRIQQEKVVDSLLATEVITIDYTSENKVDNKLFHELQHREGEHLDEKDFEFEGENLLKGYGIDFNKAYEEEKEQLKTDEPLDILQVIEETKKREKIDSNKRKILDRLNQQIIQLREDYDKVQTVYEEMKDSLEKLIIKVEKEKQEKIKQKQIEEMKEKLLIQEKKRKMEFENDKRKELEQIRKLQEHLKEERPVRELLLIEVERTFKEKSLGQLMPYTSSYSPYIKEPLFTYVIDRLKRDVKKIIDIEIPHNIEALEVGAILNKVIMEKQKEKEKEKLQLKFKQEKDEFLRNSLKNKRIQEQISYENEQKDKLCKEIKKMQSDTGIDVVRDIEKLKQKRLKDIKEIHRSVLNQYERMTQISLF